MATVEKQVGKKPKVKLKPRKSLAKKRKSSESIYDQIQPISFPEGGMKVGIYGRSNTGKTTFACDFPKPLLLIRAEEGTRSVYNVKGVFVPPVLSEAEQLLEICDRESKERKFKTVVLDTGTAYQDRVLEGVLGHKLPTQLEFGDVSRDEFGESARRTKTGLKRFIDLAEGGTNVIVLCQEREFNVDDESDLLMPSVMAALSPSVTHYLNPAMDYLIQTFVRQATVRKKVTVGTKKKRTIIREEEEIQFCLRTAPHPVYITRLRMPKGKRPPEFMVDPSYEKFVALLGLPSSVP